MLGMKHGATSFLTAVQYLVDHAPAAPDLWRDCCWPHPLTMHLLDPSPVELYWPALVNALRLGSLNPDRLAFADMPLDKRRTDCFLDDELPLTRQPCVIQY
jgi:hypothetical protein